MKQEVQVILTLEVDAEKSKADVIKYILNVEKYYRENKERYRYDGFESISDIQVKQESEIYKNK